MDRRAEAGIGTLILFVAMILVAAIAAGVLIQTSNSLQSKALYTGSRAKSSVSTQAAFISVWGEDASAAVGGQRGINRTYIKMKLSPGSDAIRLNDSMINIDTDMQKATLIFDSSLDCSNTSGLYSSINVSFGAEELVTSGSDENYLERGDIMKLCFALPSSIGEGEMLSISFVPKVGHATRVSTYTPNAMLDKRVLLYP
ncbi:MAG: archaellin/type IV pilin N-terminal domain-containing protein [Nanoarchaeota archaeon]